MSYKVKEIFDSVQGEGFHVGARRIFVRFSGCHMWSGREEDRGASCSAWCDTDFVGGETFRNPYLIGVRIKDLWGTGRPSVVFTGGEPLLQLDSHLASEISVHADLAIETSGGIPMPELKCRPYLWVTVSPKAGAPLKIKSGEELKVVWPQELDLDELSKLDFSHRFIQPKWEPSEHQREANLQACIDEVMRRPGWRLSIQLHKVIGVR